jgi:histidinol phosphatase-like enzyme (inositol monophosphatase family)
MDLSIYRQFMTELALKSGEFIKPFFANPDLVVEIKSDDTPVTLADKGAEELMRRMIRERFPSHGILGEEYGPERLDAEWVWVLDPVDGTKSFATACPLFGTLIALQYQGQPVLGAIHQPVMGQLMIGDGSTTELNGRPVKCRSAKRLQDATLLTSDVLDPAKYKNGAAYMDLCSKARLVRTWGDCYGYLLLASGWADIMMDPIMNPWDIAALIPIIRGAGGTITDWHGKDPVGAASTVASTCPELHKVVIAGLNP